MQDFPKLEKQPKWDSSVKPDKVKWDAEIKAALEKGKDVPEVTWVKPGEEEAMKARPSHCSATSATIDLLPLAPVYRYPYLLLRDAGRDASLCWLLLYRCIQGPSIQDRLMGMLGSHAGAERTQGLPVERAPQKVLKSPQ